MCYIIFNDLSLIRCYISTNKLVLIELEISFECLTRLDHNKTRLVCYNITFLKR